MSAMASTIKNVTWGSNSPVDSQVPDADVVEGLTPATGPLVTGSNNYSFASITIPIGHLSPVGMAAKRTIDIVGAAILLVVLSPLLLAVAIAVKVSSPGPVLFRQERLGGRLVRNGANSLWTLRTFSMLKFRTMQHGTKDSFHREAAKAFISGNADTVHQMGAPEGTFKMTHDKRITRVGHLLRRWSLDELPQLLNVLRGHMSLVGPRPALPYEVTEYQPRHLLRFGAKPGMSGLWQVMGRSQLSFEEMVKLDTEYAKNQSVVLDLRILAKTFTVVFSGKGSG